mmetsp:Transcript_22215/g.36781  ORF Transcript_22215/g.36781 Transcript_22215/m.36781 type:complete len:202 (-) Transcript_22215:778-1383(-)
MHFFFGLDLSFPQCMRHGVIFRHAQPTHHGAGCLFPKRSSATAPFLDPIDSFTVGCFFLTFNSKSFQCRTFLEFHNMIQFHHQLVASNHKEGIGMFFEHSEGQKETKRIVAARQNQIPERQQPHGIHERAVTFARQMRNEPGLRYHALFVQMTPRVVIVILFFFAALVVAIIIVIEYLGPVPSRCISIEMKYQEWQMIACQ